MTRRRPLLATLVALLLGVTGLVLSSTASAGTVPRGGAAPSAGSVPTVRAIVAVRGTNNGLFVRTTNPQSRYYNLGGVMVSAPAAGWSKALQTAYYVVVGTDNALWIRNNNHSWRHLVRTHTACVHGPAVLITGSTITVACTGYGSSHVYAGSATLPSNRSLPSMGPLKNQGGNSLGGESLYASGGKIYLWVLSVPNAAGTGNVYSRALSDPYNRYVREQVYCQARPAVTGNSAGPRYFLGCQDSTPAMRYRTSGKGGSIGRMLGAVGVAPATDGSHATFFVVSPEGGVFASDISPTHADTFVSLGGRAYPGLGAVTIS